MKRAHIAMWARPGFIIPSIYGSKRIYSTGFMKIWKTRHDGHSLSVDIRIFFYSVRAQVTGLDGASNAVVLGRVASDEVLNEPHVHVGRSLGSSPFPLILLRRQQIELVEF